MLNSSYGFSSSYSTYDINRRAHASDYAKSQGIYVNTSYTDSDGEYTSSYRCRSAGTYSYYATEVNYDGYVGDDWRTYSTIHGDRPALCFNLKSIKSVEIKDGVKSISDYAFYGWSNFESVFIPSSVTSIGAHAFDGCSGLTDITIPDSVASIGDSAFSSCSGLKSVTIPDSVTSIGNEIFYDCTGLTSVTIGCGVTDLGIRTFSGCSGLKNVTIPDSVTSIGDEAFYNCSSLTDIAIPDSVTSIGTYAFSGCSLIVSFELPSTVEEIEDSVFEGCTSLKDFNFHSDITKIGDRSFYGCKSLNNVTITGALMSVGSEAFANCSSITYFEIPNGVTSIGKDVLAGCGSLKAIKVPFIGGDIPSSGNAQDPLGYFFGTEKYTGGVSTVQKYYDGKGTIASSRYYIPQNLNTVTITGDRILYGAFSNCINLGNIVINSKNCSIDSSPDTIPEKTTLKSYWNSCNAKDYASLNYRAYTVIHNYIASTWNWTDFSSAKVTLNCDVIGCGETKDADASISSVVTKEATESAHGEKVYTAKVTADGKEFTDTKTEALHYSTTIPAVAPTCTDTGLTAGKKCSVCGEILKAQEAVPALGHNSDNGTVTKAPTCTATGIKTYKCTVCGATVNTETIPATGHKSDSGTVTKAPTCTATGIKTYKCTVCDATINTETIPATGHKAVTDKAIASTCTTAGKTAGSHCSVCNAVLTAQTTVAALGHSWNSGTVTTATTCTTSGVKTYKCTRSGCTATKTETIPATGHKAVTDKAIASTCTTAGKTEGSHCSVCNTVIKAQETVPATGHTPVTIKARTATAKKSGLTAGSKCSVCGTILKAQTMTLAQGTGLKASTVKTTSITLKWTAINGAKYYKVEQYNSSTKKWTAIKTTTSTSYTVSKLTAGTTYKFRVTALDSTKKIAGKASAALTATTICAAPTIKLTSTKSKTATVTITKVTGAKSYTIYKSTDNKKWTKVATTTKTPYNLTGLTAGKKIYVKVLATNADGKASAYSSVKSVTVKK